MKEKERRMNVRLREGGREGEETNGVVATVTLPGCLNDSICAGDWMEEEVCIRKRRRKERRERRRRERNITTE